MKRFDEVRNLVMGAKADFDEFCEKGNKAAGPRIIKATENLIQAAQDIRVDVYEHTDR